MASTFSPNLRLELIATGEQQGTWGATTNVNLGTLLEEAIGGYTTVTVSDSGDTTLTTSNGSADQARNMVLNLTGTISAARNVICPAVEKLYVVKNATSGGYAVTLKVSGQTGVTVPNGTTLFVYVDGTDVRPVTASMASQSANNVSITGGSITGITDIAVADGGTGASTASGARTNLGAAASGANTDLTSVYLNNTGLKIKDTDASHGLTIVPGTNLSSDRTLTLTTGDASRILDISAGNVTISTAGAALIDDATASDQRTTLGLGTIATQNANNVTITGGSISGITDLAVADGGTGASDAGTARTNLGLGTIATQNSNNVSVTGGAISGVTVSGITDLAVADGGTGASDASGARTNLGLVIGTNVQAYDATLQSISGLGTAADRFAYTTGVDTWAEATITAAGRAILDDADAAAQRTTLGLGSAATLTAGTSANNLVQLDGSARLPAVDGSQLTGISAGFSMPVGSVMPYAGATEPSGWLFCYGQAVSRTTYAALFAVLSTTYGAGDGSTTFNLPDLRGRVVAGQDDMGGTSANRLTGLSGGVDGDVLGGAGGAETHTLTEAQMPSHNHSFTARSGTGGASAPLYSSAVTTITTVTTSTAGSDQAHNNVQPTLILNYIIKT